MSDRSQYLHATIHKFKTHFSRYVRELEEGRYRAVVVMRRDKPVGMFVPMRRPEERNKP